MNEFINEESFMTRIEQLVAQKRIDHIDAVLEYCKENGIDMEEILPLIGRTLKEKIKVDAMALGMMKKQSQLPV